MRTHVVDRHRPDEVPLGVDHRRDDEVVGREEAADLGQRRVRGERLEVLKDYPTPRGCVSPYVPLWVPEMVARQG